LRTLSLPGNSSYGVISVAFDHTNLLASGSSDNTVKIWDKNSGVQLKSLTGHTSNINAVAFSKDFQLASGSDDNTVKLWIKETGGLWKTFYGHTDRVRSVAFDDTYLLASGSHDMTIKLWSRYVRKTKMTQKDIYFRDR